MKTYTKCHRHARNRVDASIVQRVTLAVSYFIGPPLALTGGVPELGTYVLSGDLFNIVYGVSKTWNASSGRSCKQFGSFMLGLVGIFPRIVAEATRYDTAFATRLNTGRVIR